MTPAALLAAARGVLHESPAAAAGGWPRMVAVLTRQALEQTLAEFWAAAPGTAGLRRCTYRTQFACLPFYLDAATAQQADYLWAALSEACHYHAYELAPTAAELTSWLDAASRLAETMRAGFHDRLRRAPSGLPIAGHQGWTSWKDCAPVLLQVYCCS
jgi:hypothetical protein